MVWNLSELIQNAWTGWMAYTDAGKLIALMLAALLYLVMSGKLKGPIGRLAIYGGVFGGLCICPLTAAFLMLYQTRFYDYYWIWSLVPVTALIALGGTVFLSEQCSFTGSWKKIGRSGIVTLMSLMIIVLCGGMGENPVDVQKNRTERETAERVLDKMYQCTEGDVCLWAPARILEYARLEADTELLYGRNMWDAALNAYSYDSYTKEQTELYLWMEKLDDWDIEISVEEIKAMLQKAQTQGVNCILLPTEMSEWLPESQQDLTDELTAWGAKVYVLDGYYLLDLR